MIGLVISGAVGRSGAGRDGRLVKLFVPAFSPSGVVGGLVASSGSTDAPVGDRSEEEGRLVTPIGRFVAA